MTPIETLFCTPEQGRRLKELVPSLNHLMVWVRINNNKAFDDKPYFDGEWIEHTPKGTEIQPALTLQELRDVAFELTESKRIGKDESGLWIEDWLMVHNDSTAPELAAWVIERLEEAQ